MTGFDIVETNNIVLKKDFLRHKVSHKVSNINYVYKSKFDRNIRNTLDRLLEDLKSTGLKSIMTFSPSRSQPDIDYINTKLINDPNVVCVFGKIGPYSSKISPRIVNTHRDLSINLKLGIMEPKDDTESFDTKDLECIILPGTVFCKHTLSRLGDGSGNYDELLGKTNETCIKLGVCFEAQICMGIPVEAHDTKIDAIITEQSVYGILM